MTESAKRRPPNFRIIADQQTVIGEHELTIRTLNSALAESVERFDDLARRHPKWCAFSAFVGFIVGGVLGKAL